MDPPRRARLEAARFSQRASLLRVARMAQSVLGDEKNGTPTSAPSPTGPVRPIDGPKDAWRTAFTRGSRLPRAVAWFGLRSFWGHIWHLAASVIATEDIDSRHWMRADAPDGLARRVAAEIEDDLREGATITEAIGRDLWIDFVADTGDDVSVSEAVAKLVATRYDVIDEAGARLLLPRGDLLIFGGDTAYPVATDVEVNGRVLVPWNHVLRDASDGKRRALLGIPGNHDWYAGLDGFGRMFRRRQGSHRGSSQTSARQTLEHGRIEPIVRLIHRIEAFRSGGHVVRRPTLPLEGYTPVQSASYWALPVAPGLDVWGIDRQLRSIDFEQRSFFAQAGSGEERGRVLILPDPVQGFLEPNDKGLDIGKALDFSLERDELLVLAGDTHHYCRENIGRSVHVTAGGGGAFLHPARIARAGRAPPLAEFPGPKASLALALQIPFRMALGHAGSLTFVVFALLYLPTYGLDFYQQGTRVTPSAATALLTAALALAIGGWRRAARLRIALLALVTGVAVGFLPMLVERALAPLAARQHLDVTSPAAVLAQYLVTLPCASFVAGLFFTALTVLGLEHHQGFSALAHPGYKHFVRLRVQRDGSAVDGWVLGQVDPLASGEPVVLVDRFHWENPVGCGRSARDGEPATREADRPTDAES